MKRTEDPPIPLCRAILVIAVCSLNAVLIGCDRDPHGLVVWHSLRPQEIVILQAVLREFSERHPSWHFTDQFYAPETARTNYIISALGGSGPALIWGASDNIGPFVELGVIRPLEPLLEAEEIDRFISEPLPANTWMDGHLYQVADRIGNHLHLVYNKALVPIPPKTMGELLRMGDSLTVDRDDDGRIDQYALVWNYTEPFFAVPFIGGFGGWIMDQENRPTLDTEPVIRAVRFIYDLANVHRIIPPECDYEVANALFKEGRAAMIINGSWSWATYIENGIDIGIARIPKVEETGLWPTPAVSPLGYSVNANLKGEKLSMAIDLLKFLTSAQVQLLFAQVSGAIPSDRTAFNDPLVRDHPLVGPSLDQLRVGVLMPPVTELRWIWDAMRPAYQAIFTGRLSPERAAAEMQALAIKLIKENRE